MPNEVHRLNIAGYLFFNCVERDINSARRREKHARWYNQLIIDYKIPEQLILWSNFFVHYIDESLQLCFQLTLCKWC